MIKRCFVLPLLALSVTVAPAAWPDDDFDCPRGLEGPTDDWTDAEFAAEAGSGIARILNTGHVIAQVWRLGPKTAYVIARLKLLDPALDDLGLMVSAYVKDGRFVQLNELDPRICFGLVRGDQPDFAAIRDLDETLRRSALGFLRERFGVDGERIGVVVGPKIVAGGELNVMVIARETGGGVERHRLLAKVSRANGVTMENLTSP